MLTSVQGTDKNQLQPGQESKWDASVLSRCSLLKPTGVLEHCREGETNCGVSYYRGVFF
jgi:hypothetical protein